MGKRRRMHQDLRAHAQILGPRPHWAATSVLRSWTKRPPPHSTLQRSTGGEGAQRPRRGIERRADGSYSWKLWRKDVDRASLALATSSTRPPPMHPSAGMMMLITFAVSTIFLSSLAFSATTETASAVSS
jgi:hypothetical protein